MHWNIFSLPYLKGLAEKRPEAEATTGDSTAGIVDFAKKVICMFVSYLNWFDTSIKMIKILSTPFWTVVLFLYASMSFYIYFLISFFICPRKLSIHKHQVPTNRIKSGQDYTRKKCSVLQTQRYYSCNNSYNPINIFQIQLLPREAHICFCPFWPWKPVSVFQII